MNIERIKVGGFKNIAPTEIELDKIVAIVSHNNYGKSNLLEAIAFATDFITSSSKDRKNMMKWVKGIPLVKELENQPFLFEVEFYDSSLGDYAYVKYGFSFIWYRDDQTGQRITDEWLEFHSEANNRYSAYLKRTENGYRKDNTTKAFRKLNLENSQLAIDVLASVADLGYTTAIQAIKSIEYKICTSLDTQYMFQTSPIEEINDNGKNIKFDDDDDVPHALYILKEQYPDKYSLFKETILDLFPEFYDIDVQTYELKKEAAQLQLFIASNDQRQEVESSDIPFKVRDELYKLIIYSKTLNQPLNISLMSSGTRRIFWLLANVFIASCTNVSCIGIEELESSIHPRLLENLLEALDYSLENTKLIISSHSPYLIQYLKADHILLGIPSENGVAQFKKIPKGKIRSITTAARDYGMSVGEYIFELLSSDCPSSSILSNYFGGSDNE